MLAYIKGTVLSRKIGSVVILSGDLGFKVFIGNSLLDSLKVGSVAELHLYQQVKEDGWALYGFATTEELEFFELLISVSGVGPRSALNILASARLSDLQGAIAAGDVDPLTKVSGIGSKTAQRLIVELKNKMPSIALTVNAVTVGQEELEALVGLGYSAAEARNALLKTDQSASSAERLKQALRYL